jgi:hypothetical protein
MTKDSDNADQEWQLFLSKISEYADHDASKWTTYTLLAYFLVQYKKTNNQEFVFSYGKRGPTKSRELKQAATIWSMFDSGRYKSITIKEEKAAYKEQLVAILKHYIDWAFHTKFHGRNTNVTGLGIFAVSNFMNEFLQWRKLNKKILPRRTDLLPSSLIEWAKNNAPDIFKKQQFSVLEDLNALYNYIQAYDENKESIEAIVLEKARELGIMPMSGKLELERK